MHKPLITIAALAVSALFGIAAQAAGQAEVRYIDPEQFSDAGRFSIDRERTLQALTEYLQQLARRLPDGQSLQLDITDVDLAGELRPSGGHELRVLRGRADWPHINLRYTLRDGSRTLKTGEAKLADMSYLQGQRPADVNGGPIAYERRMLRQWFDKTILER